MLLCAAQVVARRLVYGQEVSRVPTVQMLERDLCNELEEAGAWRAPRVSQ
jgi:hypothetical protein